jgi:hypothetical protein
MHMVAELPDLIAHREHRSTIGRKKTLALDVSDTDLVKRFRAHLAGGLAPTAAVKQMRAEGIALTGRAIGNRLKKLGAWPRGLKRGRKARKGK